jgi:hypothetical protein
MHGEVASHFHSVVLVPNRSVPMSTETFELATRFSHIRPQDTLYEDQGLRDFFFIVI